MKKKIFNVVMVAVLSILCCAFTACGLFGGNGGNGGGGTGIGTGTGNGTGGGNGGNDGPTHTHVMVYHEQVNPESCTGPDGSYDYWECTGCGKYFYDSEGISEYENKSDTVIKAHHNILAIERVEPTCNKKGNVKYWWCNVCEKTFSDRDGTQFIAGEDTLLAELGHNYVSEDAHNTYTSCIVAGWNAYHECTRCDHSTQVGYDGPHKFNADTYTCRTCEKTLTPTGGLKYELNDDGESYTVTSIREDTDIKVVIPYTHEGKPVTAIKRWAFSDRADITAIYIPNTVTEIGAYAFSGCTALAELDIPGSVTEIGENAFRGCGKLERVVIPSGVTSIAKETFRGSGVQCVEIPATVTDIGEDAFAGCRKLVRLDYAGSKAQWDAVTKGRGWNGNAGTGNDDRDTYMNYLLYCTDFTYTAYGDKVGA